MGTVESIDPDEQCIIGSFTEHIIQGKSLPIVKYTTIHGYPYYLLSSYALIPFFLLFGKSAIALTSMFVFFALIILVLIYYLSYTFFNKRVAIFASLFYVLSPPSLTIMNIRHPLHVSNLIFIIATTFIFWKIIDDRNKSSYFIALGLISGVSLWYFPINIITILTVMSCWFILDKKFFMKKQFVIFIILFMVGFSPFFYNYIKHDVNGFFVKEAYDQDINYLNRFNDLILNYIPDSFHFEDKINIDFIQKYNLLSYFYYLIFIISIVYILIKLVSFILRSNKKSISRPFVLKIVFIVLFLLIFIIFFIFTKYSIETDNLRPYIGHRYLLPIYPFMMIMISYFFAKIHKRPIIFYLSFIPFIAILIISTLSLISIDKLNSINHKISCSDNLGMFTMYHSFQTKGEIIDPSLCNNLGPKLKPLCITGWAEEYGLLKHIFLPITKKKYGDIDEKDYVKTICDQDYLEPINKRLCNKGMSYGLGKNIFMNSHTESITNQKEIGCNILNSMYKPFCFIGYGEHLTTYRKYFDIDKALQSCKNLASENIKYCIMGIGTSISMTFKPKISEQKCNKLSSEYVDYCYIGLGNGLIFLHQGNLIEIMKSCNKLEHGNEKCLQGLSFFKELLYKS
jgi:hypothetical protein